MARRSRARARKSLKKKGGIEIVDHGMDAIKKEISKLKALKIYLGVQGSDAKRQHPNADATIGEIAIWNHYGTYQNGEQHVPPRPFIDEGISRISAGEIRAHVQSAIADIIDGRAEKAEDALATIGEDAVEVMREAFDDSRSWAEPLAKSTKIRKGHDQPLLDTGTLREAIGYTVRRGGKIKRQGTIVYD